MEELEDNQLILNRYRLLDEAGSGGFSTVMIAWDTRIQRRVAIKCMKLSDAIVDEIASYDADINYLDIPGLAEARTAALLNHPSIVSVYDFEVEGDTAYLIMEYVDGLTLTQVLSLAGDDMNIDMVTWVFENVANALEYAHENQVLHLDIKPDNILIDHDGRVFVTDFGLARLSGADGYQAATGGTIGYMPPEQVRRQPLDERCDEWALASITYEMITGENPFRVSTLSKAAEAVEDAEIAIPSLCMEGLPAEADDVLFFALDPDREERYDTVKAFAEELHGFLGNGTAGQKQLSWLAQDATTDEEPPERAPRNLGQLFKFDDRTKDILFRIWGAASTAALGYAAISNISVFGGWSSMVCLGTYIAFIVASAILPHIGLAAAATAVGVGLAADGAYVPGVILAAAAVAWWITTGRNDDYSANAAFSPALFGAIGFSQIAPLLIGLRGKPNEALRSSVLAALLALCLAGFGSASLQGWQVGAGMYSAQSYVTILLAMLGKVDTWVFLVTWIASGWVTALVASKGSRVFGVFGVCCGFGILFLGGIAAMLIQTGGLSWMPSTAYMFSAAMASLFALVAALVIQPAKL